MGKDELEKDTSDSKKNMIDFKKIKTDFKHFLA